MKKIIFRNILFDCLIFFLISLVALSVIIWVFQAVNYLDIIIEDGRDYLIYISYSLLNFPKILVKLFPFSAFLSFVFIFAKYEKNNELIIFWNIGINKIDFINFFFLFSFFLMILQIILTTFLVPYTQDKARNILKSSSTNIFDSFVKTKNFNDNIKGLTIYIGERNKNDELANIYLKKQNTDKEFQITYAKKGYFNSDTNAKTLVLFEGETLSVSNDSLTKFSFDRTDYNLSKFESNTTTYKKTQELLTKDLLRCIYFLTKSNYESHLSIISKIPNCSIQNMSNINKEIYKRIIIPLYLPLLILISLMLTLYSKENINYNNLRFLVFILGMLTLVFSESSLRFIDKSLMQNINIVIIPILSICVLYGLYIYKLRLTKKNYK